MPPDVTLFVVSAAINDEGPDLDSLRPFLSRHLSACRSPEVAKIRTKMMYASSKDFFKSHLEGLSIELQVRPHPSAPPNHPLWRSLWCGAWGRAPPAVLASTSAAGRSPCYSGLASAQPW